MTEPSRQVPPMTLKPPPQGKRSGSNVWQWAAIAIILLMVIAIANSGSGGDGKKSAVAAKPDCGTPSPQPSGDIFYGEVAGDPLVHGEVSCARLLALSRAITRPAGNGMRGTPLYRAQRAGWDLVPDRLVVVDDDQGLAMVFGRPGAQVAIVPKP